MSVVFARVVAWLIVPVYIAGTGANIWLEGRLRPNEGNLWEDALLLVGFGAFAVVGALLVAKKPGNLVGWILASAGLMAGVFPAGDTYAAYVMATSGHPNALAVFGAWAQGWYWFLLIALVLFYLQTLEAFSSKLREETDLNRLDDELVAVVKETLQPAHISLWLWDGGR